MRECFSHVLNFFAIVKKINVACLYIITDGAPGQCKNRFMAGALVDLVKSFGLSSAEHCFPPTATFKGVHDAEGHVDVYHANDAERRGIERFTTTRNLLDFLWTKDNQPKLELDIKKREIHTMDERVRILVMDEKDLPTEADRNDERILILDRENQMYNVNEQTGIKARGSMKAVKNEEGVIMRVRDQFCSCLPCMQIGPTNCTCVQTDQVGNWETKILTKTPLATTPVEDLPLVAMSNFLSFGGSLPVLFNEPKVVVGYVSTNNRDVRFAIVVKLPEKLASTKVQERQTVKFTFSKGEYIIELLPLKFIKEENGFRQFILTKSHPKPKIFIHRLIDIILPTFPLGITKNRYDMLNMVTVIPDGADSPHTYKIPLDVIESIQSIILSRDAANKQKET